MLVPLRGLKGIRREKLLLGRYEVLKGVPTAQSLGVRGITKIAVTTKIRHASAQINRPPRR